MTPAFTHTFQTSLAATPARVFAALTAAPALAAWYAEHVAIDPRVDGEFACWGRFTYGTPTRASATGRITRFEPDACLSFTWIVDGAPSEVTWRVEPQYGVQGETTLHVTHAFAERPATPRIDLLIDDLWRLQCGNLAAFLAGEPPVRVDFADPTPEVRLSIEVAAPAARVFHALTDPAALARWVAKPKATVDLRVGGHYDWGWTIDAGGTRVPTGPTTILELVPNARLVTDWPDWRGDPTLPKSRVSWILEALGPARTRVTLVHDHFQRPADISDYPFGWAYFVEKLRGELEG